MRVAIIIPSRLASTRLPNKALVDVLGTSLVMRVYKQASASAKAHEIVVATDHDSIYDHVISHGGKAVMTSIDHLSGTDRIAEAVLKIDCDIVINVQGDEPLIEPRQIDDLIDLFNDDAIQIATQCKRITDFDQVFDFNVVKVIRDNTDKALYFSRQAIPAVRDEKFEMWPAQVNYFRHIGIYGFRKETLLELTQLPQTSYETAESLEQLRWLQSGYNIYCAETHYSSIGVDTEDDVDRVAKVLLEKLF